MKKLLLIGLMLVASVSYSQERYYGNIKTVEKGKTKIDKVSITIDDENERVYLSTNEPKIYTIKRVEETNTDKMLYKLELRSGDGGTYAELLVTDESVIYTDNMSNKKIVFDSRTQESISLR